MAVVFDFHAQRPCMSVLSPELGLRLAPADPFPLGCFLDLAIESHSDATMRGGGPQTNPLPASAVAGTGEGGVYTRHACVHGGRRGI